MKHSPENLSKKIKKIINTELGITPAPRRNAGNCPFCSLPVFVAEGQLYKTLKGYPVHKPCRKKALLVGKKH